MCERFRNRLAPQDLPDLSSRWGVDLSIATKYLARNAERRPRVRGFFDPHTFSVQYVASDPATSQCAIIDPVLDFDEKSGSVATTSADAILRYIAEEKLTVQWILDTHPHADHLSAAHYLHGKPARRPRPGRMWSRSRSCGSPSITCRN